MNRLPLEKDTTHDNLSFNTNVLAFYNNSKTHLILFDPLDTSQHYHFRKIAHKPDFELMTFQKDGFPHAIYL